VFAVLVFAVSNAGCSGCTVGDRNRGHQGTDGGPLIDGRIDPIDVGPAAPDADTGPSLVTDSGFARSCAPDTADAEGCPCNAATDTSRTCWPYMADPNARNMGVCTDGTQTCMAQSGTEFSNWGPCMNAVQPGMEACTNALDDNCNGLIDCADPTCASDPACNMVTCGEFSTRPCYTGPPATENVGACHDGTQTCMGGAWGDCVGEQLPQHEDCTMARDLNCNHLHGCFDLFVCATSPACQEHCPSTLDPGCVCPSGEGDVATCPSGMHAVTMGTIGGTIECCPCSGSTCGDPNCCAEAECAGNAACGGLTCMPLNPSTCTDSSGHLVVNADCDDFPEDCDEPCCACYGDCSGAGP
jgi:hypothetical protein